jgi:acyl-CoA dehydrogenase
MALVLNEEQQMLKNSAKEFFDGNAPVSALRRLRDEKNADGYDKRVWEEMVQMGWSGLVFPEEYGGLQFGYTGLGQILHESGKTLTASPLISTVALAGTMINEFGSSDQKEQYISAICEGKSLMAVAFEEKNIHKPLAADTIVKDNKLSGTKKFVLDGHIADILLVTAVSESGLGVYIVDARGEGVHVQKHIMMDSRNASTVTFDDAPVIDMIGLPGDGGAIMDKSLDVARICLSAEMLGGMEEAFTRTMAYLKERKQFGVSIGSFQSLQHRAAHMYCEIELCKSLVIKSLQAIDENADDLAHFASMTKAKVGQIAELVSNEAIQMYGGIGMTDDEEIGFFLKRARVSQQTFGDYNYHLDRYAVLNNY